MIVRPTVFVLGAGASEPYGFRTAYRLLDLVYQTGHDDTELRRVLVTCGFKDEEIIEFCRRLKGSGQYSIDAFLEREPKYLRIGKATIAFQLLLPEFNILANDHPEGKDWYRYLFARMAPRNPDEFRANRLQVITFNFDHSFEWRLTNVLRNTYALNQDDAIRLAGSIPVLHIHGELATKRSPIEREHVVRSHQPAAEEVTACIDQIRIGTEAVHSKQLLDARDFLLSAEVICFLGFSFNQDNLDKLQAAAVGSKTLHGTCLGMSAADVERVYQYFKPATDGYLLTVEIRHFFDRVTIFASGSPTRVTAP
jgi:hypothetical protein